MNPREIQILGGLLRALAGLDGHAETDVVIHATLNIALPRAEQATLKEFDDALRFADSRRWVRAARDAVGRNRWVITPEGRLAAEDL